MNNHNKNAPPLSLNHGPTLIPVVSGHLNEQRQQLVDARRLHRLLDVRRDFSNWIRARIEAYRFDLFVLRGAQDLRVDSPNRAN
jgi:anti-repressor protein